MKYKVVKNKACFVYKKTVLTLISIIILVSKNKKNFVGLDKPNEIGETKNSNKTELA